MKRRSRPRLMLGMLPSLGTASINEPVSPQAQQLPSLRPMRST